MKISERYYISKIDDKIKNEMIEKHHYLHRLRGSTYSFGLYDRVEKEHTEWFGDFDKCVGVIMYSVPAAFQLCDGVCGKEYKSQVIELSRLWIADGTMKNVESYLISNTLKMLDNHDIVVSYADPSAKHLGIVYQATNFVYTGKSGGGRDLILLNKGNTHSRGTPKIGGYQALVEKYGKENVGYQEKVEKHRYIYFACSKKKRKLYMSKLKWDILPYPKTL